jgi:hypothetical protein
MSTQRYYLSIADLAHARGENPAFSFQGVSAESFAQALQAALREPTLWQQWSADQTDPDSIDPALGLTDPSATVSAKQADLHVDIEVVTSLSHTILKHRLALLAGHSWELHDVKPA